MKLDIQGRSVYCETLGKGDPVLFLHGWGGSSLSLKDLAQLVAKEKKVILIDLPGFGQSDDPDSSWGVEEYANVIVDALKKLKIKKTMLLGHSFGGTVAIYLAAHHPELIEKLILIAPSYKREGKRSPISKYGAFLPSFLKRPLYQVFFPQSELYKYPHLEKNFRKLIVHDVSADAVSIKKPTVIIWGTKDSYVPISQAHTLSTLIEGSKLIMVPESGHGLPLRNPKLVYDKLGSFI